MFPRLWGSDPFLIDDGILELLYIYVFTSSLVDKVAENIIGPNTHSLKSEDNLDICDIWLLKRCATIENVC